MNHVTAEFIPSLQAGLLNENVIAHEFTYQGVPVKQTEGKNDFDLYLPDGRSVEIKLDLRSQATGSLALEWPTLQRGADIYILTTTIARVFTSEQVSRLYNSGKIPAGGFGQQGYDGRYVRLSEYYNSGTKLWEFIKALKQQQ